MERTDKIPVTKVQILLLSAGITAFVGLLTACDSRDKTAAVVDLSTPVGSSREVDLRVLYALSLKTAEHDVSAVGKNGRTLQIFDGNCTNFILTELEKSIGAKLTELGFTLMICYDGDEVFARKQIKPGN